MLPCKIQPLNFERSIIGADDSTKDPKQHHVKYSHACFDFCNRQSISLLTAVANNSLQSSAELVGPVNPCARFHSKTGIQIRIVLATRMSCTRGPVPKILRIERRKDGVHFVKIFQVATTPVPHSLAKGPLHISPSDRTLIGG